MTNLHEIMTLEVPVINNLLNFINSGGCGHFALEIHKALAKINIDSKIVLVDGFGSDAGDVEELIEVYEGDDINSAYLAAFEDRKNGYFGMPDFCNGHIAIEIDGKLYDSRGALQHNTAISDHIIPEVMEEFLKLDCWNSTFFNQNRHRNIKAILCDFFNQTFQEIKHAPERY